MLSSLKLLRYAEVLNEKKKKKKSIGRRIEYYAACPLIPSFSLHANENRHIVHDRAQQQEQGDSMGHEY